MAIIAALNEIVIEIKVLLGKLERKFNGAKPCVYERLANNDESHCKKHNDVCNYSYCAEYEADK